MGHVLLDMNLDSDQDVDLIRKSLLDNGVIVLRSTHPYQLTRADQVRFTQRLGDIIVLPKSLEDRVQYGLWRVGYKTPLLAYCH